MTRITLVGMRLGVRFGVLLAALLAPSLAAAQEDGDHKGTFDEIIAHHSLEDLQKWRERHPWSLGDRLAEVLEKLLATRRAGERIAIEKADLTVAFLAETIAQDPMSGWMAGFLQWDTEACAHQETASEAMQLLPAMIAGGEGDAAWAQIEEFRGIVREGGWPLLGPDLARCAAAYLHAGDRARAKTIATELAGSAEGLLRGVVLAASERILGEIARLEGNVDDAATRTARAFEIGSTLDSGPAASLLDSIENLASCDVDTLVELTASPKEALLVVVGYKARSARKIALEDVEKRLRELPLGRSVGVVADGALAELPFEAIAGGERSVVRLARPPLGASGAPRPAPPKRIWLVILDGKAASPAIGSDEVRTLRGASAEEIRKAASGCSHLYVDADPTAESLRACKLVADVALLARPAAPALVDALHACGVRDVLVRRGSGGEDSRTFLDDVCARLARGEALLDAVRSAGSGASAGWVVRRRS